MFSKCELNVNFNVIWSVIGLEENKELVLLDFGMCVCVCVSEINKCY